MIESVQAIARRAIGDWLATQPFDPVPTVIRVEEPGPPGEVELPTFGIAWGQEAEVPTQGEVIGTFEGSDVYSFGELEIPAAFVWRVDSQADAEKVRATFRARLKIVAHKQSGTRALELPATFYGIDRDDAKNLTIYPEIDGAVIGPTARDTAVVDYWIYQHAMKVTYPDLVVDVDEPLGLMNVIIDLSLDGETQGDVNPFAVDNYGGL